jgi:hypothetical protein
MGERQRFLITSALRHLNFLEAEIPRLKKAVGEWLGSVTKALAWLATIPGVSDTVSKRLWRSAVWARHVLRQPSLSQFGR